MRLRLESQTVQESFDSICKAKGHGLDRLDNGKGGSLGKACMTGTILLPMGRKDDTVIETGYRRYRKEPGLFYSGLAGALCGRRLVDKAFIK